MSRHYRVEGPNGGLGWGRLDPDEIMEQQCNNCWHIYEYKCVDGKWGCYERGTEVPHKCPEKRETVTWDTTVREIYKKP